MAKTKFSWSVDGVAMPAPVNFDIKISALDADSGRDTTTGLMHRNVLSLGKYTLSVEYAYTDTAKTAKVLQAVRPKYIKVTFPDPETGNEKTITAYAGDRSVSVASANGIIFKTLKFDLVER